MAAQHSNRTSSVRAIAAGAFPLLVFLAHVVFAYTGAYARFIVLDMPLHLLGGFAIAFFLSRILTILGDEGAIAAISGIVRSVFLLSLVASSAVFWEFAEFISDHVLRTHSQLDLEDTLSDMALGIMGGLVFVVLSRTPRKNEKSE